MEKWQFLVTADLLKTSLKQFKIQLINKCPNPQMIPLCNNSFSNLKYLEDDDNCSSSGFRHIIIRIG